MSKLKDSAKDFAEHGILSTVRDRIKQGDVRDGSDVVALRKFLRMIQEQFAQR